ncbi:MAG: hypothetical protein PHY02_07510 [Phycisphaerae bacterium]|nr:hypothetical protein [Phycisphaerae bacterium]
MLKKHRDFLLTCLELGLLVLLTPKIFWKIALSVGPIEIYVLGHYTYLWFSAAIAVVSVVLIIFTLLQRFVKSVHIKILVIWGILILATSVITSLFAPFMISGAF